MDWLSILLIVGAVLSIPIGIISCIVPPLPGPLVSWLGLLAFYFVPGDAQTSLWTLGIYLGIVALILTVDYFLPILATKKFGGTNWGVWGGIIGAIAGLFFPPAGIILGPLFGAIIGDLIGGNRFKQALKSGFGNFMGFIMATIMKIGVCIAISIPVAINTVQFIKELF